jgi:hypothetical protein
VRKTLFNRYTVPPLQRRFSEIKERNRVAEWSYWKILLFYTERGYRSAPTRRVTPVPTRPESGRETAVR